MKKLIALGAVIIGLTGFLAVDAKGENGQFISMSHSGVQHELFQEHEKVYIGKKLKWTGKEKPVIKDVRIYTNGSTVLKSNHPEIRIHTYIDETEKTQAIYNINEKTKPIIQQYVPAKDYRLTSNDFTLVFEVELLNPHYLFNLDEFEMIYELGGKEKQQKLILKSFMFNE